MGSVAPGGLLAGAGSVLVQAPGRLGKHGDDLIDPVFGENRDDIASWGDIPEHASGGASDAVLKLAVGQAPGAIHNGQAVGMGGGDLRQRSGNRARCGG